MIDSEIRNAIKQEVKLIFEANVLRNIPDLGEAVLRRMIREEIAATAPDVIADIVRAAIRKIMAP